MSRKPTVHSVGIVMNGVTGRMGLNQHLRRSICAIMEQGGVRDERRGEPSCRAPCWWGATPPSLRPSRAEFGGLPWTTDLDDALADPAVLHLLRCADHGPAL